MFAKVDRKLKASVDAQHHTAASYGLVSGGRILRMCGAGTVEDESASEETVFLTASISKTIVATVCMTCVDRGELDLDLDINTYLDESLHVRNPNYPHVAITIRHLLTHTSGLRDNEEALRRWRWKAPKRKVDGMTSEAADKGSAHDSVDLQGSGPLSLECYVRDRLIDSGKFFEAGLWTSESCPGQANYHYSNAGFSLAGYVCEKASGFDLDVLARERIFHPLAMRNSSFFFANLSEDAQVAIPHNGKCKMAHYECAEWPAAQLRSSVNDLCKLLCFLTRACEHIAHDCDRDDSGQDTKCAGWHDHILSMSSLREMIPSNGPKLTGGLAWWGSDTWYGEKVERCWAHGGFMDGVRTHIYLWPSAPATGIVVLTNGTHGYESIVEEAKTALRAANLLAPV